MLDSSLGLEGRAHGPRYITFHPTLPVVYVVNELSSTVSVFNYDHEAAARLAKDPTGNHPVLCFQQNVATVPTGQSTTVC